MGCLPQAAWPERLLSEKSGRCGIAAGQAWRLPIWLIVVISVRQSTVAAISGLHCGRWLWSVSSIKRQPDCKIQRSGRNGQRDWCMSRVTAIISALVICIIVCLSWAVNHYRDCYAYSQKLVKMPENWSWRTRQLLTCRCVSVMLLRSMPNTRRVSWCAENDALYVMMLPLVVVSCTSAVCQSVREATTASGVDNLTSPTGRHRWTGLFHPQKADHYAKTTGRSQKYINSRQCR